MKKKVVRKHNSSGNCFVCGINNDWGLHSNFYELEDGTIAALITADFKHQSYPGRVHGGVICAMLDETMGRAINVSEPDTWAATGHARYMKQPLSVIGDLATNGDIWELVESPDDPAEIDIPELKK